MASGLITALRGIVSVVAGIGMAYIWTILRDETDWMILAGVGAVTALMVFALLHFLGKGSG